MNLTIRVLFPKDRTKLGTYSLVDSDGEVLFGPAPCLGIADRTQAAKMHNPKSDPLLPFGNTPTGLYRLTIIPKSPAVDTYGPTALFYMTPEQGPCVQAEKNGRSGLLIHGGKTNPAYTQWKTLIPTYGCIRVFNADLARLMDLHAKRAADAWKLEVKEGEK